MASAPRDASPTRGAEPAATGRAVQLSGMTELPRPGFNSVPPVTNAAPDSTAAAPATGFDLARVGAQPSPPPAPPPASAPAREPVQLAAARAPSSAGPAPAAPAPERVSLSAVIASITVPPQELAPDENAVDITKLKPAPPKVDPKVAEAKKLEAQKAEEKKAAAKKAAEKPAPPKHPKRYWVQVAGGANRADLAKEWKRLTGEAPDVFKGKQAWWTPLNATNRLLAGPFSGPNEAQAFVNTLAKNKLSGFAFTSPEGQEVTKIGG